MPTFLPYPDFAASAAVLDDRRLGKQRVEALQVLRAVTRETYGWKHVPGWLGDDRLHRSHQAALVRKDPTYYQPPFPDTDPDLPYFWPTQ